MRHVFTALTAAAALAVATTSAQAADYVTEPTHTAAAFEISHFGASINRARFDKEEGKIQFDAAAKTGRVELTIDVNSISSGVAQFDKHLKSPDIFDAEKFPTVKFVGDKFNFNGDKVASVDGQLTIKGKTHPVTLKAIQFNCYQSPMLKREVCGGEFDATIDRTQFDLGYGMGMVTGKDVRIIATVEAVRQ
ncbi:YceI family protein [Ottowia sp.]|uniref:YceI family protein n=1 Tax=Ottowia sp. TaxID=1898956 RepID=UPI003A8960F0